MDKLKQTFSRNKDGQETSESTVGPTGKSSGQGSHFSSAKAMDNSENLGSTVAGQQDQGIGGTRADPAAARGTAGPEAGAGSHVNTISADSGSQGTAAAGQTTTYSTHHLGKGDPTSSIIDTQSSDPTTYQKPEAGAHTGSAGVPSGSAETAARKAFTGGEGMPGAYPSTDYKNPYLAENLDPRVDGLPIRPKETAQTTSRSSALPATAAATAAVGGGAAAATSGRSHGAEDTTPATSGLTSTANPADRSADYTSAEQTRVPDAGAASTTAQDDKQQSSGFVGKALAAVGLGGAGAAAGYGLANRGDKDSAVSDAPAESIGQVGHSRKESIPTTAYPGGDRSPAPINAPVGGTREAQPTGSASGPVLEENDRHVGRDAALGAAGGAAAGGLISSQTHKDAQPTPGQTSSGQYPTASAADTTLGSDNTSKLRDDLASQPSGIAPHAKAAASSPEDVSSTSRSTAAAPTGATSNEPWSAQPEDHTKRNAALAGAGVGALGAGGAYAATRDRKEEEPFGHTAIHGPDTSSTTQQPSSTSTQPQTTAGTTNLDRSATGRQDDPTTEKDNDHKARNAAIAGGAVGAGAAGVAGAGILEHNKRAEEEAARQRAAADEQRRAAEKSQKDAAKQAEKDEKKHQKEVEKAEKQHEKEVAKAEKQSQKEEEHRQKELEKQRTKDAEEEERRKKAAAAGVVGGAGAAGAGAYAYDKSRDDATAASPGSKAEEKEKKPGLFRRIFKRRKNKETGEDEDYSSEEEVKDEHGHKGAVAGAAAGTAAAGAGAYGIHEARSKDNDASNIGTAHTTDTAATTEPTSTYEAASGGAVKPSYNPFSKDDPSKSTTDPTDTTTTSDTTGRTTAATAGTAAGATTAAAASNTDRTTTATNEPTLGTTSSDTRPSEVTTNPVAARTAETHINDAAKPNLPIEPTLGLPYDPSKDPEAARRLNEASETHLRDEKSREAGGVGSGSGVTGGSGTSGTTATAAAGGATGAATHSSLDRDDDDDADPTSPGGTAKKGFRQKLKEAITGHKDEESPEQHSSEHGVLHKKPHQVPEEVRSSTEAAGRTSGTTGTTGTGTGTSTTNEPEDEWGRGKTII